MTHTPGPWRVEDGRIATSFIGDRIEIYTGEESREGDLSLIAAAPELLEALKAANCPEWVHNAAITDDIEALRRIALFFADWWNNTARAAIAKAQAV